MDKANTSGILDSYNSKYLINYFIMGEEMTEPENWDTVLKSVHENLNLTSYSGGHTFNKEVSQKCQHEMFLSVKWRNDETGELDVFDQSKAFTSTKHFSHTNGKHGPVLTRALFPTLYRILNLLC